MRCRLSYEGAAVDWMRRQQPSLLQVIAVLEWAERRRSLGPDWENSIQDPDSEREEWITKILMANIDIRFGYNHSTSEGPIMWVRGLSSY